jgi:DNA-binding HxlR family transcriptional regulator
VKPDHPEADCPMLILLEGVANKWAVLVVATLWKGPLRFNALKRTIGGVSQKMLSKTVRGLERDGLISRTAIATVPVTVEYAITPLSETLARTMDALRIWSADHIAEVVGARAAFDARAEAEAWPHKPRRAA